MKKINFVIILLFAFLVNCADSASSSNSSSEIGDQTSAPAKDATIGGERSAQNAPVAQVALNQTENTQAAPVAVERKIIRNAELQLESEAPEEAQQKIAQIAESFGGFVVESTQSSNDAKATRRDTVTMTVRVPAAKFSEALDEIRKASSRVVVETVKGQDVTEEFIDIEARLKAERALEEQFLEIMKRGNTVQDALNVQKELAAVRSKIEQIEGRRRYLENQTSLSTVKIRLQTPAAFSANAPGFFNQLGQAFGNGLDAALAVILFFVTALIALLPFFIFIVLPIYLLIRYLLRKNRKPKLAREIAREEIKVE